MKATTPPPRQRVRRSKSLASYDRALAYRILDEALLAHVGFVEGRQPFVIPMAYVRDGDHLLLHAAMASRFARTLATGAQLCACVTLLDGLVLARSVFNHSMNYRCVIAFGTAQQVNGADAKRAALERFTERMLPGRWHDARQPSSRELAATSVLTFHMQDLSIKTRSGPPTDAQADLALPVWAGVVPLSHACQEPVPDAGTRSAIPDYLLRLVQAPHAS